MVLIHIMLDRPYSAGAPSLEKYREIITTAIIIKVMLSYCSKKIHKIIYNIIIIII